MARCDLRSEHERGETPAETEKDAVEVDGDDGDVRRGYDRRFAVDSGEPADPEHHEPLGEAPVKERAFTAPGFDDEREHETGRDEFDDAVDTGGEERRGRTRDAERSEYLRGVIVDRVRPGPLLEKGEQGRDEATERDGPVFAHLAELGQEAEFMATSKVGADLGERGLDFRRGRVGARDIRERFRSVFITSVFDEPTRRFWLKEHEDEEEDARNDLNDDRQTPLCLSKRDLHRDAIVDPNWIKDTSDDGATVRVQNTCSSTYSPVRPPLQYYQYTVHEWSAVHIPIRTSVRAQPSARRRHHQRIDQSRAV